MRLLIALLCSVSCAAQLCVATVAGPTNVEGAPPLTVQLYNPFSVQSDGSGGFYIGDQGAAVVRRAFANGTMFTVAGMLRTSGSSGDGGPATLARLNSPTAISRDGAGGILFTDRYVHTLRRVFANGTIVSLAGLPGSGGYLGDGGPATLARLNGPMGAALDSGPRGGVFIADTNNHMIRYVFPNGTINRIAGNGTASYFGDGGPGRSATLSSPNSVWPDGAGGVFIAELRNHVIRYLAPDGTISTYAGNRTATWGDSSSRTSAAFRAPQCVTGDDAGGLLVADTGNCVVRRISAAGIVSTLAGVVSNTGGCSGMTGDNGPATSARINGPTNVASDGAGGFWVTDYNSHRVRRVTSGIITTVAGGSVFSTPNGVNGNGGPGTLARFVTGAAFTTAAPDPSMPGAVIISDFAWIRRLFANGSMQATGYIGRGGGGYSGNGGPASSAQTYNTLQFALDGLGGAFVPDYHIVRRVFPNQTITLFAGNTTGGYSGNGGPATRAMMTTPTSVAISSDTVTGGGSVFIADSANAIRRAFFNGTIFTIVGNGTAGYSGDGGPGTSAMVKQPVSVASDGAGGVIFADGQQCIRRWFAANASVATVAGRCTVGGYQGDGGPATSCLMQTPRSVTSDGLGGFYVTDSQYNTVRWVQANGIISTIIGRSGMFGFFGDGGPATRAMFNSMSYAAPDDAGGFIVLDANNGAVRRVFPAAMCAAPLGSLSSCAVTSGPTATCTILGLVPAPPLFAWLNGALCTTTLNPSNATGGAATVACSLTTTYFVGTLQWTTQFGSRTENVTIGTASPTQSASLSQTQTQSSSQTASATQTPSQTQSSSLSTSPSQSQTATLTLSKSPSQTQSASQAPTTTQTQSSSQALTLSQSQTQSQTASLSSTRSPTLTPSETGTPSGTTTPTQSTSLSTTLTPSCTQTPSVSQSPSQLQTRSGTGSASATQSYSQSPSQFSTGTHSQTLSETQTGSQESTSTQTQSSSGTRSQSASLSATRTQSVSRSETRTGSMSSTPSVTASQGATPTSTRSASPTITGSLGASPSPTSSPCTLAEVPILVPIVGGVSPADLVQPQVGVLLRLSLSCYLQTPLRTVTITGAVSSSGSIPPASVGPSDPVNLQTGFCAQVNARGLRQRVLHQQEGGVMDFRQSSDAAQSRALVADSPLTTTMSLLVTTCNAATDEGAYALPTDLQARLAAFGVGATPSPGSSPAPSPPPTSFLNSFLNAAAGSVGVSSSSLSSGQVLVGPPAAVSSLSRSASPSISLAMSATPLAAVPSPSGSIGAAAQAGNLHSADTAGSSGGNGLVLVAIVVSVVVLLLFAAAVIAFLLWRRKRVKAREKLRAMAGESTDHDSATVSVVNRMYGSGSAGDARGDDDVSTEKGRAAVAAFKAARIAAARAAQEAIAAAPMDLPPTSGPPAAAAAPGQRPSGRAHRGKLVVVKAVFGPQETKDGGGGAAGGGGDAPPAGEGARGGSSSHPPSGGRVTAKLRSLKGGGAQQASLAMLRQPRSAGGAGGGGDCGPPLNPLIMRGNQGTAAPPPPPPPPPRSTALLDPGSGGDAAAAFECDSPLRIAQTSRQ